MRITPLTPTCDQFVKMSHSNLRNKTILYNTTDHNSVLDCEEQDSNFLQLTEMEDFCPISLGLKITLSSAAGMMFRPWILIRSRGIPEGNGGSQDLVVSSVAMNMNTSTVKD